MKKEQPQPTDPQPVSQLYTLTGGMARLWSDGWHCTCHQPGCKHIEEAKKLYEAEKAQGDENITTYSNQ